PSRRRAPGRLPTALPVGAVEDGVIGDKDGPEIDRQAERHCPRHLSQAGAAGATGSRLPARGRMRARERRGDPFCSRAGGPNIDRYDPT
ncbi:MAG TPA: hypothetical protein VK988_14170, partial [Acidimicrobiales bacterium]|nr:hypothetical protein [Acidimicrobiales bacterium]